MHTEPFPTMIVVENALVPAIGHRPRVPGFILGADQLQYIHNLDLDFVRFESFSLRRSRMWAMMFRTSVYPLADPPCVGEGVI